MIRKGIVKEMLKKIEKQNDVKIEAIRKKLDIKEEIEKERQMSTLVELVNKGWTNNSPRNNDSLKGFNSYSLKEELKCHDPNPWDMNLDA